MFSKITFLKSVRSKEKDEACLSFLEDISTKSVHRGGVDCYLSTFTGQPPMRAQCVLPSGITKVGETQTVDVINCNGNHCFQEDIGYEAAMPQIIALLESSSSCSQTIDFQCFSAPLKVL